MCKAILTISVVHPNGQQMPLTPVLSKMLPRHHSRSSCPPPFLEIIKARPIKDVPQLVEKVKFAREAGFLNPFFASALPRQKTLLSAQVCELSALPTMSARRADVPCRKSRKTFSTDSTWHKKCHVKFYLFAVFFLSAILSHGSCTRITAANTTAHPSICTGVMDWSVLRKPIL